MRCLDLLAGPVYAVRSGAARSVLTSGRILILRPDHLGDVLLATPAMRAIRQRFPSAHLACAIGPWSATALAGCTYVDELIEIDLPWFCRFPHRTHLRTLSRSLRAIRRRRFDLAIDFRADPRSLAILWLSGAPRRVGFAAAGGGFLLTDVVPYRRVPVVQQCLDIAAYLGADTADRQIALPRHQGRCELAAAIEELPGPRIVLAPETGSPFHRWSDDRFVRTAQALAGESGGSLLVVGTEDAASLVRALAAASLPAVSLVGKTPLACLGPVLAACNVVLCVDSVVRHVAAAVGAPAVVIRAGVNQAELWGRYAPTEIVLTHPVPCSPCGLTTCPYGTRACIMDVSPKQAAQAARRLITSDQLSAISGQQPGVSE